VPVRSSSTISASGNASCNLVFTSEGSITPRKLGCLGMLSNLGSFSRKSANGGLHGTGKGRNKPLMRTECGHAGPPQFHLLGLSMGLNVQVVEGFHVFRQKPNGGDYDMFYFVADSLLHG